MRKLDERFAMSAQPIGGRNWALMIVGLTSIPLVAIASSQGGETTKEELKTMEPARGYLEAHADQDEPMNLLGGGMKVSVEQDSGGVFVALPAHRDLDEDVFGVPGMPRSWAGSPGVTGVPPKARGAKNGKYTKMKKRSPFGDAYTALPGGTMELEAVDQTATDAKNTKDRVQFAASWKDEGGNTYEVVCCEKMASAGIEYPTFGGVVTNHIMHGWSHIGTPLMPTMFNYVAFWGIGNVKKNGEVIDANRIVHGMLTEYVRGEGYRLVHDHEVTPSRLHFHLMVAPVVPSDDGESFDHRAVNTGLQMKNGETLPFWHVMFAKLDIDATPLEAR